MNAQISTEIIILMLSLLLPCSSTSSEGGGYAPTSDDGVNIVVTDDSSEFTITPASSTMVRSAARRGDNDDELEDAMTPSTPRKFNSLPAYVAKPSILQAYPSRLGEENVEQSGTSSSDQLGDKQERFGNYWRSKGCQQYLLQVRKELHCTATPHFEHLVSFDARLRDQDTNAKAQRDRLESIERTMQEFRSSIDAMGRRFAPFDVQRDDDKLTPSTGRSAAHGAGSGSSSGSSPDNAGAEALAILTTMTQRLRERLHHMEDKMAQTERERVVLVERNRNLSLELDEKKKEVGVLMEKNRGFNDNQTRMRTELIESKINISKLTSVKAKMMKKIIALRNCRMCTANNRSRFKQCQKEAKKQLAMRRTCTQRLQNITVTLSMLTSQITDLKEAQTSSSTGGGEADGTVEVRTPCKDDDVNTTLSSVNQKQKQCGRLTAVGDPVLISEMDRPGKKCGVWMRDTMQTEEGSERIWSLNIPGRQACASSFNQKRLTNDKKRREPILTLYQYANERDFCLHLPELRIQLPKHKQMESTGAVIYNGSLFYQRRNSRRIIKFDIDKREIAAEIPLKNAGFHGMFAYQWGGYSDVDLAVDEFGLWVIYSSTDHGGNIIVTQLNPENLETIRTITTNMKKSEVANSFIVCGVLYTVSSYNRMNVSINYAYNLLTDQPISVDIPFKNAYRYNTMIDYNPADQQIYSWDNGRRVIYPVTVGNWEQETSEEQPESSVNSGTSDNNDDGGDDATTSATTTVTTTT